MELIVQYLVLVVGGGVQVLLLVVVLQGLHAGHQALLLLGQLLQSNTQLPLLLLQRIQHLIVVLSLQM